jgi:hypothetical protein
VAKLRRDLEANRQELVAQRVATEREVKSQMQAAYQQHHAQAVQMFPWLKDKNSAEYQGLQEALRMFPGLRMAPDHEIVMGHYFRGLKMYQAEQAAKSKPKPLVRKPAPAREPTRVQTEAPGGTVDGEEQAVSEAQVAFQKSGRMQDLARSFAARARVVSRKK